MESKTAPAQPPTRGPGLRQAVRALRQPGYRWYWISGIGTVGAQTMQQFTILWLVLDLTGSAGQLGLVVFFQGAPMTIISLFGGVLADRYDRRSLIIASQLLSLLAMLSLALLTLADQVQLWHVYAISMAAGVTQATMSPARQAMISALVAKEDLTNAVSLNSMQQLGSRILWPALAGFLILWLGIGSALLAGATCLVLGILPLLLIRGLHQEPSGRNFSPVKDVIEGINYARSTPVISLVVGLTLVFGAFGLTFVQLGAGFARDGLGFGAGEAGIFIAFVGVGSLLGGAAMSFFNVESKASHFLGGTMGFGLTLILFALNPWAPLMYVIALANGMANTVQVIASNALFQVLVPSRYLGRVVSLWFLAGGVAAVAALPIGLIGDLLDLRTAFAGAGTIYIVIASWFGILRPRLFPRPIPPQTEATPASGPNRDE